MARTGGEVKLPWRRYKRPARPRLGHAPLKKKYNGQARLACSAGLRAG